MKIMISFISLIIVLAGVAHFLPLPIPTQGMGYAFLLFGLAAVAGILAFVNKLLVGPERFFIFIQAALVAAAAALQFLPQTLTVVPRSGPVYAGIIIIIGLIGLVYGIKGLA